MALALSTNYHLDGPKDRLSIGVSVRRSASRGIGGLTVGGSNDDHRHDGTQGHFP